MSKLSHYLSQLAAAVRAFNSAPYARTSAKDRAFIVANARDYAESADDNPATFEFEAARAFFDYVTVRTRKASRLAWEEFAPARKAKLAPATFTQDGFTEKNRLYSTMLLGRRVRFYVSGRVEYSGKTYAFEAISHLGEALSPDVVLHANGRRVPEAHLKALRAYVVAFAVGLYPDAVQSRTPTGRLVECDGLCGFEPEFASDPLRSDWEVIEAAIAEDDARIAAGFMGRTLKRAGKGGMWYGYEGADYVRTFHDSFLAVAWRNETARAVASAAPRDPVISAPAGDVVTIEGSDLQAVLRAFPDAASDLSRVVFEFDPGNGDLIDVRAFDDNDDDVTGDPDADGPHMVALAQTAWRRLAVRPAWLIRAKLPGILVARYRMARAMGRGWQVPARDAMILARADTAPCYTSEGPTQTFPAVTWQPGRPGIGHVADVRAAGLRLVGRVECDTGHLESGTPRTGWHTDPHGDVCRDGTGLCYGEVYQLPGKTKRARLVAGYSMGDTDSGPTIDFSTIYSMEGTAVYDMNLPHNRTSQDVCYVADGMARIAAEEEREYREAYQHGSEFSDLGEEIKTSRKSALALLREFRHARGERMSGQDFESICRVIRASIESTLEDIRKARSRRAELLSTYTGSRHWGGWAARQEAFHDGAGLRMVTV